MSANREYKNSVFSFLFSDPDTLRELYGALKGITLPPELVESIKRAVKWCVAHNKLKQFLELYGADGPNTIMQKLSKYNIETLLELKQRVVFDEPRAVDDARLRELESAVNAYLDEYPVTVDAQKQEEYKSSGAGFLFFGGS
jgi:hypothetical protein